MSDTSAIVKDALRTAVIQTVRLPTNDAPSNQAGEIAAQAVARPAVEALVAKIDHATNNEPWFQSRVILGSAAALVGALYALGLDFADGTPPTVDAFTAQFGIIAGSITALYGRLVATKPIGQ